MVSNQYDPACVKATQNEDEFHYKRKEAEKAATDMINSDIGTEKTRIFLESQGYDPKEALKTVSRIIHQVKLRRTVRSRKNLLIGICALMIGFMLVLWQVQLSQTWMYIVISVITLYYGVFKIRKGLHSKTY